MEGGRVHSISVPVSPKIHFAALIPPFELKTEVARGALPEEYSRRDAVYNLSRSALMTAALFSGSLENLRVAVQDRLHQPYRMKMCIRDSGDTRDQAIRKMKTALGELVIEGISHNAELQMELMGDPRFVDGTYTTGLMAQREKERKA